MQAGGADISGSASFVNCALYGNVGTSEGGAIYNGGVLTMTNCLLESNIASTGASIYSATGSSAVYVLPAPPAHWVPARECKVYREACPTDASHPNYATCPSTQAACAEDTNETASGCQPVTFYQPCDWSTFPEFVGKTIYSLPQGAYDDDLHWSKC